MKNRKTKTKRKSPGTGGTGRYYHVEVKPKTAFRMFRTQDVGEAGHLERVAGKRSSGRWDTVAWLISKEDAHVSKNDELIIDNRKIRTALKKLRGKIMRVKGDIFSAKPRISARVAQPTMAEKRTRSTNIRKAQVARSRKRRSR